MDVFGHVRISVISPEVQVGNPRANVKSIIKLIDDEKSKEPDIILLPELAITGYTCANLFQQSNLIDETIGELNLIASRSKGSLIVIGCPIAVKNSLYNCAVVMDDGRIVGIVPKQYLPNYREFYELRWFRPADGSEPSTIDIGEWQVPFGIDLLFEFKGIKISFLKNISSGCPLTSINIS
jgi:NAD+ synthase (glutamine-hydrolysing)